MSLTSPNPCGSRATATISAPASASTRQISVPIPLEAPVTSAFLPSSEKRLTNSAIASTSGSYDFQLGELGGKVVIKNLLLRSPIPGRRHLRKPSWSKQPHDVR